ncbi:MAG TPA: helix-turn-helix transcriptional regulator [Eubacteriales bacterium]|nr:helix-turn-helix transcriptional regulator [Eubacteriales bacterium]
MKILPKITSISAERLRELRVQNGYTQRQLAEALGIRQQSYVRYEYGTSEPSFENLKKLCEFYSVSSDYLLGISDY